MEKSRKIPVAVVRRLPNYLRHLDDLESAGTSRISSQELSVIARVSASQLRQDLSIFGRFGHFTYGYDVAELAKSLRGILGVEDRHNMVVIGAGNLGRAVANYENFGRRGFHIRAVLDNDPQVVGGTVGTFIIEDSEKLHEVVRRCRATIGIITVPAAAAQGVADGLVAAGIKGIWNFSPVDIVTPAGVAVENVHLSTGLMSLAYQMKIAGGEQEKHAVKRTSAAKRLYSRALKETGGGGR